MNNGRRVDFISMQGLADKTIKKDMLDFAGSLINQDKEIEAFGVLKLLVLKIESDHKFHQGG